MPEPPNRRRRSRPAADRHSRGSRTAAGKKGSAAKRQRAAGKQTPGQTFRTGSSGGKTQSKKTKIQNKKSGNQNTEKKNKVKNTDNMQKNNPNQPNRPNNQNKASAKPLQTDKTNPKSNQRGSTNRKTTAAAGGSRTRSVKARRMDASKRNSKQSAAPKQNQSFSAGRSRSRDGGAKPKAAPTWAKDARSKDRRNDGGQEHVKADAPVFSPQLALAGRRGAYRGTNIRSAASKLPENTRNLSSDTLKIIPLGGLCEIGKNMTVYQYGDDLIIVDVGVSFPEETQPGIDAVIPDFSYVIDNIDHLRAIFITHGHEDHIGSLPYLMKSVRKNVPIYAGKLAAELIKLKFEDRGIKQFNKQVYSVLPGQSRRAGCFEVEFINVNHSIADAFSLAINSPAGMAVHSGDFKIDYTPVNGVPIDLPRFAELGSQGVLVYVGESTNIDRPGFTMSERSVGETFAQQFAQAEGRVFVATFSSNVSRVQQIITAAEAVGRKVALVGRSMLNVFNAANKLGYLHMKEDTLVELDQINRFKPEEVCVISTGSQGEPMSALTRMAYAEHRSVDIHEGDTVIISATPIPGNEKPIYRVIDELYKRGAKVVYSSIAAIHVSGHANREEHKIIHELLRPKYFVPAHGEYRMLYHHGSLAHDLGVEWENIFILNNGDIFECNEAGARIGGYTSAEAILIDGSSATLQDSMVLQQRKDLSEDGVVSVALCLNKRWQMEGEPAILSYGALLDTDASVANSEIARFVSEYVRKNAHEGSKLPNLLRSRQFRNQLQNFFYSKTGRRPVTLVSVFER